MEKTIYLTKLYDIYGNLLTDKQQEYFKLYYFENLTLDEISDNLGVSKANVSKKLNATTNILENFEKKLKFLKKIETIEKEFQSDKAILDRIERILK